MIPKEIIEKWGEPANRYAKEWSSYLQDTPGENHLASAYIQGRTDQYNEQVKEIERLKEFLEKLYRNLCIVSYSDMLSKEQMDALTESDWNQYKQQHNL